MIKHLTFLLLVVAAFPASAQDWELFPLGNMTYYADSLQDTVTVESYYVDSIRPGSDGDVHYFNKHLRDRIMEPCGSTVPDPFSYMDYLGPFMDSLVQRNDTVLYRSTCGTEPFIFLPQAAVGHSWTVQSDCAGNAYTDITIECIGQELRTFLGITDSVKVFSMVPSGSSPGQTPVSNFQFVLSKAHGLVEFVPFDLFLRHPSYVDFRGLKLVGYHDGTIETGFRKPGFSDLFHLHAGDALLWEFHFRSSDISVPETYTYEYDSLTYSSITPDSVSYNIVKTEYAADGAITTSAGPWARFVKTDYDNVFNALTFNYGMSSLFVGVDPFLPQFDYHALQYTGPYRTYQDPITNDTITAWSMRSPGNILDTTYCEIGQIPDINDAFDINTRVGYTYVSLGDMQINSVNTRTLIWSRINGIEQGDFIVGIHGPQITEQNGLTIRPNPAKTSINLLGLPQGASGQFTIYDGLGHEAMHGALPVAALSVEGLQPGVYMVQVRLPDRTATARFVKE
jgi:hypothetical protein